MEEITYAEAEKELNNILEEIEKENVDIDNLTVKIKRACELLKFCNSKLKSTDEELKKILEELNKTIKIEEVKDGSDNSSNEDLPF